MIRTELRERLAESFDSDIQVQVRIDGCVGGRDRLGALFNVMQVPDQGSFPPCLRTARIQQGWKDPCGRHATATCNTLHYRCYLGRNQVVLQSACPSFYMIQPPI